MADHRYTGHQRGGQAEWGGLAAAANSDAGAELFVRFFEPNVIDEFHPNSERQAAQALVALLSALVGIGLFFTLTGKWEVASEGIPEIICFAAAATFLGALFSRLPWYVPILIGLTIGAVCPILALQYTTT